MIDFFKIFVDYIGIANLLATILFLLCLFFAFIFYFRTFYRLVYSTGVICPNCKELGDFVKKNNQYKTRVLFYNNGRKTLTKEENKGLTIISKKNGSINNAKILKGDNIGLNIFEDRVDIQFDNLDAKNLFIIEIEHNGHVEIYGRVSETGKILNTEPQNWVIIIILFFLLCIGLISYTFYEFISTDSLIEKIPIGINFLIVFLIAFLIRYIHSLFFIPDSISAKYLNSKSKVKNEFLTQI